MDSVNVVKHFQHILDLSLLGYHLVHETNRELVSPSSPAGSSEFTRSAMLPTRRKQATAGNRRLGSNHSVASVVVPVDESRPSAPAPGVSKFFDDQERVRCPLRTALRARTSLRSLPVATCSSRASNRRISLAISSAPAAASHCSLCFPHLRHRQVRARYLTFCNCNTLFIEQEEGT